MVESQKAWGNCFLVRKAQAISTTVHQWRSTSPLDDWRNDHESTCMEPGFHFVGQEFGVAICPKLSGKLASLQSKLHKGGSNGLGVKAFEANHIAINQNKCKLAAKASRPA